MIYIRIVSEFFPLFWHEANFGRSLFGNEFHVFNANLTGKEKKGWGRGQF